MEEALQSAITRNLITKPQLQQLPQETPFFAALCVIELPLGCEPPISGAPRRLATGYSPDKDTACFLALAEAAERYSLQYSSTRPTKLEPFMVLGDSSAIPIEQLTIGAPGTNGRINSQGCAAGADLVDAGRRAVLERLEHLVLERMLTDQASCHLLPASLSEMGLLDDWLYGQFRKLSHLVHASDAGYVVTYTRCADFDDGRPCYGSAAATSLETAILSSSLEAIFHWRNMVEIERRGTRFDRLRDEEELALREYRGARPQRNWPEVPVLAELSPSLSPPDIEDLMGELQSLSGSSVLLFDLTAEDVDVSVVRAVLR